ncbi:microsomal epoxide hydrolase [Xylariaceae sp. FL0255]|nr:microsomal epoxide hydrolase [Xylariaceae sp. FL0255]
MADIKPYKISVPDSELEDLKARLKLTRFPDELESAEWDMGSPLSDVKRLTKYWQEKYDWRAAEAELNQSLPHFVTPIQCDGFRPLQIHFIHIKSGVPGAVPLVFIHGWPGHFLEATKIVKLLTEKKGGDGPVFDIVVPSLPNFAFSEGTKERGFALEQYAETVNKLMLKLGYNEYVTQGGDWGAHISRALAHLFPKTCKATLLNYDSGSEPSFLKNPLVALQHAIQPYTQRERDGFRRSAWFNQEGRGYNVEQSTKPQTLGYGLADSPSALLAWIYEKLHDWSDNYPWTDDEVCTWVSIYWFSTAGPAASVRIYYETQHNVRNNPNKVGRDRLKEYSPGVKLGFSHFPQDLVVQPSSWQQTLGDVVFDRCHEGGGHFAAFERPMEIVQDLRDMFGKGGGAFTCVKGATGYSS